MKTINSLRSKLLVFTLALMASVSTFAYDFVFANDFHIDGFGYRIISNNEPRAVGLMEIADCTEDVVIPATVTYNGLQYIVSTVGMGGSIITNDARITIKSIFIPKTIQVVNMRALSDCPHLCSIVVDEENPYLDSRNDCNAIVTSKDWGSPANTLIAGCQTTTIPNSVTEIGNYAFYRCDSLKHMTVPNGVTTISDGAFSECSSLSSIKLPESLTQLTQQWIFSECTSLKEVFFFAKTPPYIAYGMFRGLNPTIFVPKESLDAYKNELYWQDFDIQAIPYKSQWCDTWNTLCSNQNQTPEAQTWQYTLGQDTIIEGKTYTIVNRHWTIDPENTEEYVASVRFTNDDKVFVFYDNTEYLLYDFNVQVDDSVEVFAGINNYDYAKTYKGRVYDISYAENGAKICKISVQVSTYDDGYVSGGTYYSATWIEGIGDAHRGLLFGYVPDAKNEYSYNLLCAYKGDELMHETDHHLFDTYGCEYNGEIYKPRFFEGLQRTECSLHTTGVDSTYLVSCDRFVRYVIKNKLYWKDINSGSFFRETKDQIILSFPHGGGEECVLYDFSLEIGDTLPVMQYDEKTRGMMFRVVDVSMVTLLDGKKYKKWTLACGYEYIEKIGAINGKGLGNYIALGENTDLATYIGAPLVCASRNGKLLYQMDAAEMERLGAECLCDYDRGPRKDNAKDGQIGGRPTPTQWNQLEVEFREMENGNTILQAETFSYTLEDISQQVNSKTYFQLARQSTKDTATTKSIVGALHFGKDEDNRVYFLRDGVEYVLYDFTAEPGDTIEIFAGINNYPQETTYTHVVIDKDTTEDGACRMFLEVVFPDETTTATNVEKVWLAGLGSIDGIVHNSASRATKARSSETQTSVMLCAWRDDDCLYTTNHPDYNSYGCVYNQDPTAVDNIPTSHLYYHKILCGDQLLIIRDSKIYNVIGQEILSIPL